MAAAPDRADDGPTDRSLALYIHWPFCLSKCPYCDFNSHVAEHVDADAWRRALVGELARWHAELPGRTVTSVFFGGGTPSLMDPRTVAAILDTLAGSWGFAEPVEITLEANPTSVEAERFRDYAVAGVNRASLGVQSLRDDHLRFLGRGHTAADARNAVAVAATVFQEYSFDLIYALPHQTSDNWRQELADALSLAGNHLSVYQLTIEPGTPFHRDRVSGAGESMAEELFTITQKILSDADLPAYEISNHARPGHECRHNLSCWQGRDYLGIGPGAHGRICDKGHTDALINHRDPAHWLAAQAGQGRGLARRTRLSPEERAEELVLMGLRTVPGIDSKTFRDRTGRPLRALIPEDRLRPLVAAGMVWIDHGAIGVTRKGRLQLDGILGRMLAG